MSGKIFKEHLKHVQNVTCHFLSGLCNFQLVEGTLEAAYNNMLAHFRYKFASVT